MSSYKLRTFILSLSLGICACLIVFACSENVIGKQVHKQSVQSIKHDTFPKAAVVSAHPIASDIGLNILKHGGNAVDAAIAVQFALAVCYPIAGNIGGGGFMVIRNADGTCDALDFREVAPLSADRDMFLDESSEVIEGLSLSGSLASGVPGSVDGMWKAFLKYSSLKDWRKLVEPSVELARRGFPLTELQAANLNEYRSKFLQNNSSPTPFVKGSKWKAGDILIQEDLAKTLQTISENGRDGFYSSWVADRIVEEMKRGNGRITQSDLSDYSSKWREPLTGTYRNYRIVSMPPPSSGGLALVQLLNMLESVDVTSMEWNSSDYVHLLAEAEKRVFADRSEYLGDPDFYSIPVAKLTSKSYCHDRMRDFSPDTAAVFSSVSPGLQKESDQTTHFSIVDSNGNAVSLTTTLNTAYGSGVVISGAGFLMNNEMDDFSIKPGHPNYFGLIGSEANAIVPGKRMLSSMSPTIIEQDGRLHMVLGSPGGSKIITSVFQAIINTIDFQMNAFDAVSACRFHHQWFPDILYHERGCLEDDVIRILSTKGHVVKARSRYSRVEIINCLLDGQLESGADPRGDDSVSGY